MQVLFAMRMVQDFPLKLVEGMGTLGLVELEQLHESNSEHS